MRRLRSKATSTRVRVGWLLQTLRVSRLWLSRYLLTCSANSLPSMSSMAMSMSSDSRPSSLSLTQPPAHLSTVDNPPCCKVLVKTLKSLVSLSVGVILSWTAILG